MIKTYQRCLQYILPCSEYYDDQDNHELNEYQLPVCQCETTAMY